MFDRFFAHQLARPSGLFGRYILSWWLRNHTRAVNAWALEQFRLGPGDRLLDVGFGSGKLLSEVLCQEGRAKAAGLDLSEEMVRLARWRMRTFIQEGRLEIRQGSIDAMPFEDARFSRLISVNTLYFWPSPASALAECRRVLEDQGELLLCFDAKEELERWSGHRFGFTLYEPPEVETLLREAGFVLLAVSSRSFPGYGTAHCVFARKERQVLMGSDLG